MGQFGSAHEPIMRIISRTRTTTQYSGSQEKYTWWRLAVKAKAEEKMDAKKIEELKTFVEHCKQNPSGKDGKDHQDEKQFESKNPDSNEDIVESDVELDNSDVVAPDNGPPQKMGDPSIEVTEENQEAAQLSKAKAMDAIADAKGYKARGMARAMLGLWEEAASDLHVASKLDFDEEIGLILKKVEPNANKIEEHRRKYERLRKEKELRKIELERKRRQVKPELNAAKKTSRLAIIYFTATWCGPCRYVSPVFSSLAGKYPKVVFLKVDIDEASDAAAEWNISSVPSFFFIKNGKEVDKVVGADKDSLEKKIAQHAG
ncbi:hypothetical protein DH2020_042651 [Rehmannia glutinosa]|uniref:Thioredoxin domain-containing protein n=1 Tax=Rehmannia glutinosa TaxID=99300 RepID=A0ABR0UMN9_REHGL